MTSRRALAGMTLLIALASGPALSFDFLEWDDPEHVTRNPLVITPERASLRDHVLTPALGYPIPLTVLSYRVEHALCGLRPALFHASNVLLHVAVAWLAFSLARVLGLTLAGALLASLWFALHPANAEVVSWVSGRKDLLAAALALSALLLSRGERRRSRVAAVSCYALALLCKPVVALLALLVPFLPRLPQAGASTTAAAPRERASLRELVPYGLVLAPIAVLGALGQRAVGAVDDGGASGMSQLRAAAYAFGHHARLALWLEEPTAKYLPAPWPPAFPSATELSGVGLCLLLALALRVLDAEHRPAARFGMLFALLAYLPSSSLFVPLARFLADSYVYLPTFGLGLVWGALFDQALARSRARFASLLGYIPWLVGVAFVPAFWLSASRFENDLALWSHAHRRFPHHARVCRAWSNAVIEALGPERGIAAVDVCIAEFGDELFVKNRGIALARLGRREEAIAWLTRALERAPHNPVIARYLASLRNAPP